MGIPSGIGFGAGAYIAFRVIDYMFGPHYVRCEFSRCETLTVSPSSTDTACDSHSKALQDCFNGAGSDFSKCKSYMDRLFECRRTSSADPSSA